MAWLFSAALAAVTLWAPSAWAAQVTNVRVGNHAQYTRVVFELDSFVGYQIEQHGSDVVVAFEAGAQPASIRPSKGLIEVIEISVSDGGSAAHIQLSRGGLQLKEMTLANPPRIVIDVLAPGVAADPTPGSQTSKTAAAVDQSAKASKSAEASPASPKSQLAEAQPSAASAPSRAAVEAVTDTSAARKSAQAAEITKAATRTPAPSRTAETVAAPANSQPSSLTRSAAEPPEVPSARRPTLARTGTPDTLAREDQTAPSATRSGSRSFGSKAPARPDVARQLGSTSTATPTLAKSKSIAQPGVEEEAPWLGGPMVWASAGVGFVLLVAAGVVLKRRSGVTEFDDDEFDDSAGGNPFADLTPDSNESTPSFAEPAASDPAEATEPVPFGVSLAIDPAEATEPVPFGQPVDMGSELRDAVPTASSRLEKRKPLDLPIVAEVDSAGAGSAEIGILLKEIERRVAGIETRINELADGREQIERQVAAQTEELRVQRAAIARTQRAVRNMSRTDDAQATEPAPRDPRTA